VPIEHLPRPERPGGDEPGDEPASVAASVAPTFAPSFAQERLWFLDRMGPGNPVYNLPLVVSLTGALHPPSLARTLDGIARRHESLRTTLPEVDGGPVQRVHPPAPVPLPRIDLAGLPEGRREGEARRLARSDAERSFDLSRGPLFRAALVDLGRCRDRREHRLLASFHPVISDGWSFGIFLKELAEGYAAFVAGEVPEPPPLPIQYAEFAAWQREWLDGQALERAMAYWRSALAGAPAVLELPTDRPRPPVVTFRGGRVPFRLDRRTVDALGVLGRGGPGGGATLYMVLLVAFTALLARHSGQSDLVVGSPVAGRNRREVEGLIGFFVNTLVLRNDLSGDPSFPEVLAAVRRSALGAYGHQEVPFERLVQELVPERSVSHTPLFQVLFALQSGARRQLDLPGLSLEVLDSDLRAAKFDLVLSLGETVEGIRGSFQYNADLFDATTIERMAGHLGRLVAAVLDRPSTTLSRLPLLSAAERHAVRSEWNDTASRYPRESSIGELFESQARRRPDAVALRQGERTWSYAELERRSARVAARLAAALTEVGAGPGTLVGIAAARSPELIAGLLGIVRAGAAYLPLDADYPEERLRFMLADGGAPVVLGTAEQAEAMAPALGGPDGARWLSLEEALGGDGTVVQAAGAAGLAGSGSLAYVLYTSGSTGRPKGVRG
jgi:hypothetical protein